MTSLITELTSAESIRLRLETDDGGWAVWLDTTAVPDDGHDGLCLTTGYPTPEAARQAAADLLLQLHNQLCIAKV